MRCIVETTLNNNFNNKKNFILFKFLHKNNIANIFANIKSSNKKSVATSIESNNKKSIATSVKSNNKKSVATSIVSNNKKSATISVKSNNKKSVLFLFTKKQYLRLLIQSRENFSSSILFYRSNNIFNILTTKKL